MYILIPNKYFIPVKYIDKNLLHLYDEDHHHHEEEYYHDDHNCEDHHYHHNHEDDHKDKKSKKCKYRDSIIDYFNDMENNNENNTKNKDNTENKILSEIDEEYVLESTGGEKESKDLFLDLNDESIEKVWNE